MSYEPLNRRLSLLAAIFALVGVLLGGIALGTNYWTIKSASGQVWNGTELVEREYGYRWNGLFQVCQTGTGCSSLFRPVTFIIGVVGLVFLLIGGVFAALDLPRATDRRFVTPLLLFVASILLTAAAVDYASLFLINSHSSRAMVAALVFSYVALPLAGFVAGRYSALERNVLLNNDVHLRTQKYSTTNGNSL